MRLLQTQSQLRRAPLRQRNGAKRVIAAVFGGALLTVAGWAYWQNFSNDLQWWMLLLLVGMGSVGILLLAIAAVARYRVVNKAHEALLDSATRSIVNTVIDQLC